MLAEAVLRDDERMVGTLAALVSSYAARLPVRRVAVIGNAPLAPDPRRARSIDACDVVIRCNSFVTDAAGLPAIGRRTHVVVINAGTRITRSVFAGYSDRLYLRSSPGAVYRRRSSVPMPKVALWPEDLGAVSVPNRAVVAPLRELIESVREPDNDAFVVPTTGMVACWLGRRLFPDAALVLAGFSAVTAGAQAEWLHHGRTESGPVPVSTAHKIDAEGIILRRWVTEGQAEYLP